MPNHSIPIHIFIQFWRRRRKKQRKLNYQKQKAATLTIYIYNKCFSPHKQKFLKMGKRVKQTHRSTTSNVQMKYVLVLIFFCLVFFDDLNLFSYDMFLIMWFLMIKCDTITTFIDSGENYKRCYMIILACFACVWDKIKW